MTPAERASAVAFALKNCALEAMTPGPATMQAAADYERGSIDVLRLIEIADNESDSRISRYRLADGSLDDTASDHASSLFARNVLLAERGWKTTGDLSELTAIHNGLFTGVFDDAGKLRTSNTTRERSDDRARAKDPEAFFPASLIETGAMNISTELAEQHNLTCLDRDEFIRKLAKIYDELGYLHPFKGGNAMVLRIFASRLAHDAGWDLDWGPVTRETCPMMAIALSSRAGLSACSQWMRGSRPNQPICLRASRFVFCAMSMNVSFRSRRPSR